MVIHLLWALGTAFAFEVASVPVEPAPFERCAADMVVPDQGRTGRLIVASQSGSATIIDLRTGTQTRLTGLIEPHGAAMSADGRWAVVTDYGRNRPNREFPWRVFDGTRLQVIDMHNRAVARTIDVGVHRGLHDVKILSGDPLRAVITAQGTRQVIVADLISGKVTVVMDPLGEGTHSISVSKDEAMAFASNEGETTISRLDLRNGRFDQHFQVGAEPLGLDVTPDGREVWVGTRARTVVVLDATTGQQLASLDRAGFPDDIAVTPDGRHVLIFDAQQNTIHVVRAADRQRIGAMNFGRPSKAVITPDSRAAFVSLGRENQVIGIDLERRCIFARFDVASTPDGIGWGPSSGAR